jgi:hypothetical protein
MKTYILDSATLFRTINDNPSWFGFTIAQYARLTLELEKSSDFVDTVARFRWADSDGSTLLDTTIPTVWYGHFGRATKEEMNARKLFAHWLTLADAPRADRRHDSLWPSANELFASIYGVAFHTAMVRAARLITNAISNVWRTPGCYAAAYVNFERPAFPERVVDTVRAIQTHKGSLDYTALLAENICRKAKMIRISRMVIRHYDSDGQAVKTTDMTSYLSAGLVLVGFGDMYLMCAGRAMVWIGSHDVLELDDYSLSVANLAARLAADPADSPRQGIRDSAPAVCVTHRPHPRFVFSLEAGPWFKPQHRYRRRFSVKEVSYIRDLYRQGHSPTEITSRLQCEWQVRLFRSSIVKICANESYKYDDNYSGVHHAHS